MIFFPKQKKANENKRRVVKKIVEKSNKAARKRVSLKLNTDWLKKGLLGVGFAGVSVAVIFGLMQLNTKMSITYWDIEADAQLKTQIDSYLKKNEGLNFWRSRASVLQEQLLKDLPDIAHVQVNRILPDGLLLKAKARKPVALWKDKLTQHVMIIDTFGYPYRGLKRGEDLDLPLIRVARTELQQTAVLLNGLQKYDRRKMMLLSEVVMEKEGLHLNFSKGEQWQVRQSNAEKDLVQIVNILNMPRWAKGSWRLDARMPERWFIRPAHREII